MTTIPGVPIQPNAPIQEQELTYWNEELRSKVQGTKILKEDLDGVIQLMITDLLKLRQEMIDSAHPDDITPYGLYDRLKNMSVADLAPKEKAIMEDLLQGVVDTISVNSPEGKHAAARIKELELLMKNLGYAMLHEGNTEEEYQYHPVTGEIKKQIVTGDYETETEFFYRSELLPAGQTLPAGEEDYLEKQVTKFRNDINQIVTVTKEYVYALNADGTDNNIVKVITKTEVDTTPPSMPQLLNHSTAGTTVTIRIQPRIIPTGQIDDFMHYVVYRVGEFGALHQLTTSPDYEISFIDDPGMHNYIVKAVDESYNQSQGLAVGPVIVIV